MNYPSLAKIEATDVQDLGLNIAFKEAANNKQTTAQSPEEFLAQFVIAKLEDFEVAHVSGEQLNRIFDAEKRAFESGEFSKLQSIATILGVSLEVDVPADAVVDKI